MVNDQYETSVDGNESNVWVPDDVREIFHKLTEENYVVCPGLGCCHNCIGVAVTSHIKRLKDQGMEVEGYFYFCEQDSPEKISISYGGSDCDINKESGERLVKLLEDYNLLYKWDGDTGKRIQVYPEMSKGDYMQSLLKDPLIAGVRVPEEYTDIYHDINNSSQGYRLQIKNPSEDTKDWLEETGRKILEEKTPKDFEADITIDEDFISVS